MVTRGNNPGGEQARGPRRAQGLWLQGRRAVESRLDPARQRAGLRPAPFRHSSDQAVAVPLGRAAERAARLSTQRRRHAARATRCSSRTRSPTAPTTRHTQMAGAIHIHPNGRFVYMTNRNSGTEEIGGRKVFKGGENNVAVFSIDPATRRADADPEHRGADHSSAHLRHRSERPPADRRQHPADGDARRLDAAGGARALSHRRRRQARRSRANTTSTPAASCSSGPASSRCPNAVAHCRIRWRHRAETCLASPAQGGCHEKNHDRRRRARLRRRPRPRAGLSERADPPHQRLPRRQHRRHFRARGRRQDGPDPRPAGRGREPARRGVEHRRRPGRARAEGRLHAVRLLRRQHDQRGDEPQPELRHHEGLHPDHADHLDADRAGGDARSSA